MGKRLPFARLASTLVLSGLLLHSPTRAAEDSFILGVCSHDLHLRDRSAQAPSLLAAAGIGSVRTDAHWAFLERTRDRLVVEPHWNDYLARNEAQGLSTLFILGYGNQHHGDGQKPRSEPLRAAFNRYVGFVAEQFHGRVRHYEVWNEWDQEAPDDVQLAQDYLRLVADAAGIIRQHDPAAKVLAGAVTTAGIESGFALRLVESGVMQSVDGLSLHPYVHCRGEGDNTPEAWIEWLADVDLQLSAAAGEPVPLYLTEMAWPAHRGACGIDEDLQAAYLARSLFLSRTLPNIRGYWWYDFRNDGTDPREREHNFGLLRQNLEKKPAYEVLAAISPIVRDYAFVGYADGSSTNVVMLRFANAEEELLVAWSTGKARTVRIDSASPPPGPLEQLDTAKPELGRFRSGEGWSCLESADICTAQIELGAFPRIVRLGAPSPGALAAHEPHLTSRRDSR
ncbi:hypothetical protein MST27_14190 [Pseudomonas sp. PS1]|uniref:Uncharacterized protein n=1 Tax=Stutzerimonas marianensis TaxID=2929513 RepID=A0A9X2ASG1_9GAMM|nr:hypothetical protein [Pseudomonas marianensis]MCJ0974523.1 hypothetical protein [Pseudomonas marianensis]